MTMVLLVQAETLKLFGRRSAQLGWLMSVALPLTTTLMLLALIASGFTVAMMGPPIPAEVYFAPLPTRGLVWSMTLRNFLLVRGFLVVLLALSFAGETHDRTLRESLVAPVNRTSVLLAKLLAVGIWDVVALGLTAVTGAAAGMVFFGLQANWLEVVQAFALNIVCDAALIAVIAAFATVSRSVVATVGGVLVLMVGDKMLVWTVAGAAAGAQLMTENTTLQMALQQWPFLPDAAFALWQAPLPGGMFDVRSLASLIVLFVVGTGVALTAFNRADVP